MKRSKKFYFFAWTFLLLILTLLVSIFSLLIGSTKISIMDFFNLIFSNKDKHLKTIIFDVRLPRIILSLAVGGILSLVGVILQSIFKNKLVEPYTLGISGGAALGICIAKLFLRDFLSLSIFGFLGAVSVIFIIYFLNIDKEGGFNINKVILTGVMISSLCSSLVMLIMAISKIENLQGIIFWIMGSTEGATKFTAFFILFFSFAILFLSYFFSNQLNALQLGEDEALALGINVEQTKKILFLLSSIATSICVANTGIVGFVGLVIPNISRIFISKDHRILFASSYFLGGVFLIICDCLARTIILPLELPVGVITGIVGGSIFIYFVIKNKGL